MASRPARSNRVYRKVADDIRDYIAKRRTHVATEVDPATFTAAVRILVAHLATAEAVMTHQPAPPFRWWRRALRLGPPAN